jgi:hypothetical protein
MTKPAVATSSVSSSPAYVPYVAIQDWKALLADERIATHLRFDDGIQKVVITPARHSYGTAGGISDRGCSVARHMRSGAYKRDSI